MNGGKSCAKYKASGKEIKMGLKFCPCSAHQTSTLEWQLHVLEEAALNRDS